MRKYIYSSLLFILLCSCADYLEKTPDEDMTLQEVFESRNYAEKFLTSAYTHMSRECYQADNAGFAGGASDELEITWTYPYCNKLNVAGTPAQQLLKIGKSIGKVSVLPIFFWKI